MKLKAGSLFTGIGGFDLGFEQAGIECKYQVEIDDFCTKVLEKHWPNVKRYKDVTECTGYELEQVDIISGGFPCQDISKALRGSGDGLSGTRSGLWFDFERIVSEALPRWVIIENVPALLTSNEGRDLATIISGLVQLWYGVSWRVLDAKDFGAGSTRRRLFIVARLADVRGSSQVLFEPNEIGAVLPNNKERTGTFPMCVGWDGGLSYERLRQCVVTKTDPVGTRESNGLPRRLDRYRYRALGNAVVPQVARFIGERIIKVEEEYAQRSNG